MKEQKINLDKLKVQSFVTSLSEKNKQNVNEGVGFDVPSAWPCDTAPQGCPGEQ